MMRSAANLTPSADASGPPAPEAKDAPPLRLAALTVRTDRATVAEFLRSTGAPPLENLVPLTFPICWLGLPALRAMIRQAIGGDACLLLHEAQSFAFERRLEIDSDYVLEVALRRGAQPPRLILQAAISTPRGEACGRFEAVLRLAPIASGSAP